MVKSLDMEGISKFGAEVWCQLNKKGICDAVWLLIIKQSVGNYCRSTENWINCCSHKYFEYI